MSVKITNAVATVIDVEKTSRDRVRVRIESGYTLKSIILNEDEVLQLQYALYTKGEEALPDSSIEALEVTEASCGSLSYKDPVSGRYTAGATPSLEDWQGYLENRKLNLGDKIASIAVAESIVAYLKKKKEDEEKSSAAATEKALGEKRKQVMREAGFEYSEYRHLPRMTQNLIDRIVEGLDKDV